MPLTFATPGSEVKVQEVRGTPDAKQHLIDLGFVIGTPVTVVSSIPTGLIVKVKQARIAIDRSMAAKIMV